LIEPLKTAKQFLRPWSWILLLFISFTNPYFISNSANEDEIAIEECSIIANDSNSLSEYRVTETESLAESPGNNTAISFDDFHRSIQIFCRVTSLKNVFKVFYRLPACVLYCVFRI
jgi:hypothetical protein